VVVLFQIKSCAELIVSDGGVEACVCALRANPNKMAIVMSACNVLLRLCDTTEGSVAVARQGGTRQIIQTIDVNAGMPGVSDAMALMLAVLHRVSATTEGSQMLGNQGGVDAVMTLADATTSVDGCGEMAAKILARMLAPADVEGIVSELNDVALAVSGATPRSPCRVFNHRRRINGGHSLANSFRCLVCACCIPSGTSLPPVDQLKSAVSRAGHVAKVAKHSALFLSCGGLDVCRHAAALRGCSRGHCDRCAVLSNAVS
jgi:hypothetical protein